MTLTSITTLWRHDGRPAELVRSFKYGRSTAAVTVIADRLAPLVPDVDVVTWCPAAPANRVGRGFDQSELVARAVAARVRRPCRRLLVRARGPAQTERSGAERRRGPVLRRRGRLRSGAVVLVVDDVVTTGATLHAAAVVLRGMGAGEVHGAAATRAERGPMGAFRERGCTVRV